MCHIHPAAFHVVAVGSSCGAGQSCGISLWPEKRDQMNRRIRALANRAQALRAETYALYLACRDPRMPWYARALAAIVVAYAFSPIDLIPDFIPVLGHLDDLVLVPVGIVCVLRMTPPEVIADARARARAAMQREGPKAWIAGLIVIGIWLLIVACVIGLGVHWLAQGE